MRKIVVIVIALILGVTPLLTQGNLYFMGGDDMRLYYAFPKEYIQNLLLNIVTDNSIGGGNMGYNPATHPVPLVALMWLVKTIIPANTQFVMYGINWALGFIFFYLLLGLWVSDDSWKMIVVKILSSLVYIFSPFLFQTFYVHQMIVIFLISAAPGTLYFFIKSIRKRNILYVLSSVLVISILSTNFSSIPWLLPIFITSFPILFVEFWDHKKIFIVNSIIFLISYVLLNFSWIFHLVNLTINNTGLTTSLGTYSSQEFINTNIAGILGTTRLFSPLNVVVNQLLIGLGDKLTIFSYLNLAFIIVITTAGLLVGREKNQNLVKGYNLCLLGLLISWYLMTPNFSQWGPNLFLWLSLHIPFFTMFRNMYDKFALTSALYFALCFGIGLSILINKLANKIYLIVLIFSILLIVTGMNSYQFFKIRTTHVGVQAKLSGVFNDDFNHLVTYLNNLKNPSRILWLPLNFPAFTNIEDKYNPGHYYSGPSLLRLVANRQDYAGQYSFITSTDLGIVDQIFPMIENKEFTEFGKLMQLRNARYVILDKQSLPDAMKPYLYDHYSVVWGKLKMQTDDFINSMIGKKLADFGTRYSLYEINPQFNNDRIYLTDDYNIFPKELPNVEYEKVYDSLYKIKLTNIKSTKKLVFLDTYYKDWTLYFTDHDSAPYKKGLNVPVQGFANGWEINPDEIKKDFPNSHFTTNADGSINIDFTLYFEPDKYNKLIRSISVFSFCVLGLTQLFLIFKKNEKN